MQRLLCAFCEYPRSLVGNQPMIVCNVNRHRWQRRDAIRGKLRKHCCSGSHFVVFAPKKAGRKNDWLKPQASRSTMWEISNGANRDRACTFWYGLPGLSRWIFPYWSATFGVTPFENCASTDHAVYAGLAARWVSRGVPSPVQSSASVVCPRLTALTLSCAAGLARRSRSGAAVAANDIRRIESRTATAVTPWCLRYSSRLGRRDDAGPDRLQREVGRRRRHLPNICHVSWLTTYFCSCLMSR
jgi:hypothetical protein